MASDARCTGRLSRPQTLFGRLEHLLIVRRIPISIAVFATFFALDVFLFRVRPHDLLNWSDPFTLTGMLLLAAGLFVRSWAAGTIHKNKQLTTTGPYGMVRNPLYVGSFLMMFGFFALIGEVYASGLLLALFGVMYWLKVRQEEEYLSRKHAALWPQYRAQVPRFVPRRVVLPRLADWSLSQWLHNHEFEAPVGSLLALGLLQAWRMWT